MFKSAFDPNAASWQINWPGRVSKHDLVYLTPPQDPMQGMPLGNGDIGVLCWCEDSKVILAVNKCDLWDDAEFGQFHNWNASEEEYSTTLRHACRVIIDFGVPVFDVFYLSDFTGRLALADASLSIAAEGPFGKAEIHAFVNHDDGTIYCDVKSDLQEDIPVDVSIERFGSRTFSHWYSLVNRDASIGLSGTSSNADETGIYLQHSLTSGVFSVGCRAIKSNDLCIDYSKKHARSATMRVSGSKAKDISFVVAVTSPGDSSIRQKLDNADFAGAYASHKKAWKEFWLRSLMESGDDYLDNLWHLTMYYANASQRGSYPGRFIGGLWSWNRDVQPWNFYFHWNQQETYWPLSAAGHHDLLNSYLDYRFNSLPHAKADAKEVLHADGAIVSDVCERRGYNSASEFHNHTPVAEIALDFWRQYKFTGDKDFLKERALPYMLEAAYFFESLFEMGEDGKYHAKEGTAYEGWIMLRDPITEVCYASVLFTSTLEALKEAGATEPRSQKWKDILSNLAPLPTISADTRCICKDGDKYKFLRGMFAGEEVSSDRIFASGYGIEEKQMLTGRLPDDNPTPLYTANDVLDQFETQGEPKPGSTGGLKMYDGIFPTAEFSTVFPSGLIGLSQKGKEIFDLAVNTTKLYSPDCMGWDVLPIVYARLGLVNELNRLLKHWPKRWQFYPNGFGHYGPREIMKADAKLRFRNNIVEDAGASKISGFNWSEEQSSNKFKFPAWPFRHMGMESMSVLACAMNESLLQSYDGIIRIAPAAMDTQNARFTLHAAGGFIVSSEIKNGRPLWISITSQFGGVCKMENPWSTAYIYGNGDTYQQTDDTIIEISTSCGSIITIAPDTETVAAWEVEPASYQENKQPKSYDNEMATLGLARMF